MISVGIRNLAQLVWFYESTESVTNVKTKVRNTLHVRGLNSGGAVINKQL